MTEKIIETLVNAGALGAVCFVLLFRIEKKLDCVVKELSLLGEKISNLAALSMKKDRYE